MTRFASSSSSPSLLPTRAADSQVRMRPAPAPRRVPDYNEIATAVNAALCHRGLRRSLEVASILVERVYGGDPSGFRGRASKAMSLRRLVSAGVPLSAAALYRCLAVHEIWARTGGRHWPRLTASHYRAVESVPRDEQASWLSLASERGWSAARLRAAIVAGARRVVGRGGRLPLHPVDRFVARAQRELAVLDHATERLHVAPDQRTQLGELALQLEEVGARCRSHAKRIRAAAIPPRDPDAVVVG